jgi:hypothetical protein
VKAAPTPFVTLNSFQGPWPAVATDTALAAKGDPWMLKYVQHDEIVQKAAA